uniref:Phosphatidylinositol glycan anchor biosynthesis, class Z n=1 Tax=Mus musculus TaxID=10090 RepID=A0A338P6U3_MOUSE
MMVAAQVIWGSFSLLRVLWCLLPQTGYIHPDEFFQSPEVMAGLSMKPGLSCSYVDQANLKLSKIILPLPPESCN